MKKFFRIAAFAAILMAVSACVYPFEPELDAQDSRLVIIRVSGEGFLYNMVRIIAGTLIEIGMGRRQADEMRDIIMSCDRSKAGPTAPAKGLTHVKTEII